ncbi:hypothetical protein [Burkholderia ubonensis]|uniref:hypothetical protein n=1 Tax=Burkholderia ubonensis TaxID=101571 RepID=UPI000AF12A76|nr:hypothetical protein [Burkholderia ubonensis]
MLWSAPASGANSSVESRTSTQRILFPSRRQQHGAASDHRKDRPLDLHVERDEMDWIKEAWRCRSFWMTGTRRITVADYAVIGCMSLRRVKRNDSGVAPHADERQ